MLTLGKQLRDMLRTISLNVESDAEAIRPHFDAAYYLRENPDVAAAGMDPVIHFLQSGAAEGRNPNAEFDTEFYLDANPDVKAAGINPFVHYIRAGRLEGRAPSRQNDFQAESGDQTITATEPPETDDSADDFENDCTKAATAVGDSESVNFRQKNLGEIKPQKPFTVQAADIDEPYVEHVLRMAKGKTLSLDIWDTILRRTCHPDETKLRAARALWIQVPLKEDWHPVDLLEIRRHAEAEVADGAFEYRFSDVAKCWLEKTGLCQEADVERLLANELQVELNSVASDPTIATLISRHSGRSIAVSDFYLPSEKLKKLLNRAGISLSGPVYASCDVMRTKRVGDLFDYVLAEEGVKPEQILHIGDRRDADVAVPRQKGLKSALFEDPDTLARTTQQAKALSAHLAGDFTPHASHLLGLALPDGASCSDPMPIEALAIPAVGMVMDVVEQAVRSGVSTVHFFTREGEFFKKIYEDLISGDVFDQGPSGYPSANLLEVSRRATFAASLEEFSVAEMMRLWSQYSSQSLAALAVTLNIDPEDWAKSARRHRISLDEVVHFPWTDSRIQAFFADRRVRKQVRAHIAAQRKALLNYLDRAGFSPHDVRHRLIVDIGWRGTIQDNIGAVCAGTLHGCYLGLDRFLNTQPGNVTKSGFLMDRNDGNDSFTIPEYAALEFIFNSTGGSVIGYSNGAAEREVIDGEEKVVAGPVVEFQKRIRAAAGRIITYIRNHGLVARDLQPLARHVVSRYVAAPEPDVAEAFLALEHNESFGTGVSEAMSETAPYEVVTTLQGAELHNSLMMLSRDLRWLDAHRSAGPLKRFLDRRSLPQRLVTPFRLSAPSQVPASVLNGSRILVFAPPPISGSGGHRTIYNMSRRLAEAGYDVHLMNETISDNAAMAWQEEVLAGSGITVHNNWDSSLNPAAAIATVDYSAFAVSALLGDHCECFYFIQDYEAKFNPVGDVFLRSQLSYTKGLHAITIGRWLGHVLRLQYGIGAAAGGLGIDHRIYRVLGQNEGGPARRDGKRIAFLFQPEKPRRATQLCIEALAIVKQRIPDVEIITYGSDIVPNLPFESNHRGLISDLHAINAIYNESALGLCISATNPSRIPFEMMAAGCVPVDIYSYNNLFDYGTGTGVLAYQSPQSLAEAMERLLTDGAWRNERVKGCLEFVQPRTLDWEVDVAMNTVTEVLQGGRLDEIPHPRPTYCEPAVFSDACQTNAAKRYVDWQWQIANM